MQMLRNFVFISLLFFSAIVLAETPTLLAANEQGSRKTTEAGCRQAIDQMLEIMKTTSPDTAKERERVDELIAKVEKMIDDNRRQGIDECRTWGEFNRLLVHF